MSGHPSRAWQDKGGPFLTPDERRQRGIADQPGAANRGPQRASWNDAGGPMVQPAPSPDIQHRVRAALAPLKDSDDLKRVVETNGRRVSDRLATEAQDRRDRIDSSAAVSEALPRDEWWREPRAVSKTEERRREMQTAARPRAGDYPGRGNAADDYQHQAWLRHFADTHDLDVDDLQRDIWADGDHGIPQADLDELVPRQRGDDKPPPDWWGADYPTPDRSADDADVQ